LCLGNKKILFEAGRQMFEKKRQMCQEHTNGINALSSRKLLCLRKNGTFGRISRKITKCIVRSTAGLQKNE
jgi:hypothetical protein